ncbi:MAG: hypothetical protein Q8R63_00095 [Ramlibacter sp.]|nr:hypothetical protein [Ramlibacter sp.]
MKLRPFHLVALEIAAIRGLAEFASLQRWRLRQALTNERGLR